MALRMRPVVVAPEQPVVHDHRRHPATTLPDRVIGVLAQPLFRCGTPDAATNRAPSRSISSSTAATKSGLRISRLCTQQARKNAAISWPRRPAGNGWRLTRNAASALKGCSADGASATSGNFALRITALIIHSDLGRAETLMCTQQTAENYRGTVDLKSMTSPRESSWADASKALCEMQSKWNASMSCRFPNSM